MFLIHEVNTVLKDGKALTIIQVGVLEIGYALLCYVCPEQPLAYKFDNILTCMHVFRPGNLLLTEQISVASRVRNDTKLHLPPLKAMSYLHYSPSLHHKNLWWCTTFVPYTANVSREKTFVVVQKTHYSLESFCGASGQGHHVLYTARDSRAKTFAIS